MTSRNVVGVWQAVERRLLDGLELMEDECGCSLRSLTVAFGSAVPLRQSASASRLWLAQASRALHSTSLSLKYMLRRGLEPGEAMDT